MKIRPEPEEADQENVPTPFAVLDDVERLVQVLDEMEEESQHLATRRPRPGAVPEDRLELADPGDEPACSAIP